MEEMYTTETVLWLLAGLAASSITALLIIGWLKGLFWEKQIRFKRRPRQ